MHPQQARPGRVLLDWMPVRGKITSLAALSLLGLTAATGVAQAEPGLTVDPDSPAGVEYAVPLDTARGHRGNGGSGGGGTTAPSGGADSPVLFGSGIKSGSGSSGGDKGSPGSGKPGEKPGGGSGGGSASGSGGRVGTDSPAAPVAASATYSTTGPMAAIIGGVLLLGGGLGLFLRLRARRSSPGSL
jgi:hypothetical protein